MQMPYAENPYNNYTGGPSYGPAQPLQRTGFLGRVFGRNRGGAQAVPQFDPNHLPEHPQPGQSTSVRQETAEATAAAGDQLHMNHPNQISAYETGYGNVSPVAHSPMATGYTSSPTPAPGDATAAYTYAHAGDPYTHSGDHYGHSGDDYYRNNSGAHNANTAATLPYPAENPYDSPYEPHRVEQSHQQPPRYNQGPHHYGDGIYDRP